ncbi:hypothetical protein AA0242T_1050 [Acetobacter aceti NRIC 0242]|uniref:Uncharacterized protein n=1 Tax=Acetobacter aceti NBRC 14818 TaxID=887700 RepID=A0AB33IKL7_ACEAC|nr:hypothetical protein [Acetobacter aceti]BCK77627.1 hypothetical protein EMQ_3233 [Acetobacter aceti NBRC 14818]GAN56734.1 hypothetical protein Abac_010_008 [Acetobacter aceti NBRC 14818]GBO80348.1 hypothetical protein AA0242T_1050 [Acetobacter aceti NRIC 0242]
MKYFTRCLIVLADEAYKKGDHRIAVACINAIYQSYDGDTDIALRVINYLSDGSVISELQDAA